MCTPSYCLIYYCYVNEIKNGFLVRKPFFVVDHMVLPVRLSILRKEEINNYLFTVSVDVRNS
ncbi:hypothetical protein FC701_36090 [Bacillus mycoides]|uniref:Uncharacterized protein n=1 Tax=Bacillus mycoides TaxID=1405 RepID=A0A4U2ZJJ7_BACMY|nr:hypothetical protein FC701_36090 [Bacillus mycoides]